MGHSNDRSSDFSEKILCSPRPDPKDGSIYSLKMSEKSLHSAQFLEGDSSDQDVSFPETGWQAWATVFGAALVQFATFGYSNAFGVFQDYYVRQYLTKYSPSDIGWIGGVQLSLIFFGGIVTGQAFDRGYFYHLMIGGTILHAFSFFMLSFSQENQYYQVFLSQGLGGGLACGLMYTPSLSVVSHHFLHRRALAMGIVSAGAGLGAVVQPILLNKLFHGSTGFYNGVRISAGLNAGLLVIAVLIMRTRLPPEKIRSRVLFVEFLKEPPYLLLITGSFLLTFAISFPIFFLQLYAVGHGVNQQFAFYCIAIMNATSILGRILPGLITRRYGTLNLFIVSSLCAGIMVYCLGIVQKTAGIALFASIYGIFAGAVLSLAPPILASLAKDRSELGARIGVCYAFSGISGLVAAPIEGALLTNQLHWWHSIIFAGTMGIVGSCLLIGSRFLLVQQRGTQIV